MFSHQGSHRLFWAARFAHNGIIDAWLDKGDYTVNEIWEAMCGCASGGQLTMFQTLLIHMTCDEPALTHLAQIAESNGHLHFLIHLVECGANCCAIVSHAFETENHSILCYFESICNHDDTRTRLVQSITDANDERQSVLIYCLYAQHVEEPCTIVDIHQEWDRLATAANDFWSLVDLGFQVNDEKETIDPEFDISRFIQKGKTKKKKKRQQGRRRNGR